MKPSPVDHAHFNSPADCKICRLEMEVNALKNQAFELRSVVADTQQQLYSLILSITDTQTRQFGSNMPSGPNKTCLRDRQAHTVLTGANGSIPFLYDSVPTPVMTATVFRPGSDSTKPSYPSISSETGLSADSPGFPDPWQDISRPQSLLLPRNVNKRKERDSDYSDDNRTEPPAKIARPVSSETTNPKFINFLLEQLNSGETSSIVWASKNEGMFTIQDTEELAIKWNQKNRPAHDLTGTSYRRLSGSLISALDYYKKKPDQSTNYLTDYLKRTSTYNSQDKRYKNNRRTEITRQFDLSNPWFKAKINGAPSSAPTSNPNANE